MNLKQIHCMCKCRYNGLLGKEFSLMQLRLVVACGSVGCDGNHVDGDEKLCISYEGCASSGNQWALTGEIRLREDYMNVPPIRFQSAKMVDIVCENLGSANSGHVINNNELRQCARKVMAVYASQGVKWDLVFWCKFSSIGMCTPRLKYALMKMINTYFIIMRSFYK